MSLWRTNFGQIGLWKFSSLASTYGPLAGPLQDADRFHPGPAPIPSAVSLEERTPALQDGPVWCELITHFTDEKMKAWGNEWICLTPHSQEAELDLVHRLMNSKVRVLSLLPQSLALPPVGSRSN